jgi:hypothetical protein
MVRSGWRQNDPQTTAGSAIDSVGKLLSDINAISRDAQPPPLRLVNDPVGITDIWV